MGRLIAGRPLEVPTGLAVTSTTSSSASLSWNAVTGATGYRLYRDGVLVASPTSSPYTDTGLAASTQYSYTVSAVSAGGESAQSGAVGVQTQPSAGGIVFQDNFNYVVDREDPSIVAFQSAGWQYVKRRPYNAGAYGYLYTVSSIPGFAGSFPGQNSTRVLCMESLATDFGSQTDFYMQYGAAELAENDNLIPGDVWFQYWLYPNYYGSQLSNINNRDKFLYMTKYGYPSHSHLWMGSLGPYNFAVPISAPYGAPSNGDGLLGVSAAAGVSTIIKDYDSDNPDDLGPQDWTTEWVKPNRWTLVKQHFNTTQTSGNSWKAWLRAPGGNWAQVANYVGGVDGFTWNIPANEVGGHRAMRMPSTVNGNYWIYMDDFVIATSEAALPVYP